MASDEGDGVTNCSSADESIVTIMGTIGSVSAAVSLLTVILVLKRNLHKRLVYRLAAYQASAGLLNSVTAVFQLTMLYSEANRVRGILCKVLGFFTMYTLWMNLMFTAWMTFHLFCFAVCFKNLRKMEPFYVVFSLVAPSVMALVPLPTNSYGVDGNCWIQFKTMNGSTCTPSKTGIIEEFTLWVGPALVLLILESIALVVMVTILTCRVCRKGGVMIRSQRTALVQVLPLAAYPMTLCVLVVLIIAFRIHYAIHIDHDLKPLHPLFVMAVVCYSSIGLVTSGTLVVHMCMFASNNRPISSLMTKRRADLHNVLAYQSID